MFWWKFFYTLAFLFILHFIRLCWVFATAVKAEYARLEKVETLPELQPSHWAFQVMGMTKRKKIGMTRTICQRPLSRSEEPRTNRLLLKLGVVIFRLLLLNSFVRV